MPMIVKSNRIDQWLARCLLGAVGNPPVCVELAAHTICSGAKFDLDQVDAHTLGPRLVHRALDFAFTGNR